MSGKAAHSLSATNLAVHHHLNCDLYPHYVYHGCGSAPDADADADAYGDAAHGPSALLKAQFERGLEWERRLFKWLDDSDQLLKINSTVTDGYALRETIGWDTRQHFFIAGLVFWPPNDAFAHTYDRNGFTDDPVKFGLAKPDLVEILRRPDGVVLWRVIDAKSSKAMKTPHHVQIYFYHMCLQHLLRPPQFVPFEDLAIWLPSERHESPSFATIKTIGSALLSDSLKAYIFRRLPALLARPRAEVPWHFSPRCRGCPFEAVDSERARRGGHLGALANVSQDDAAVLRQVIDSSRVDGAAPLTDIEELHRVFASEDVLMRLEREQPVTLKQARRVLGVPVRRRARAPQRSAAVEAARSSTVQVVPRRNYTCPRVEDIAVVVSLLQDPLTNSIATFSISVFSAVSAFQPKPITKSHTDLIAALSSTIRSILALHNTMPSSPTCQFYVFSAQEATALQSYIIDAALTLDSSTDDFDSTREALRLCVGALCEGAALLALSFQPTVLYGALLEFMHKPDRRVAELRACLQRLNLPTGGQAAVLRTRLEAEVNRIRSAGGLTPNHVQLGHIPRVVVLKREMERMLALPIPGYWDLSEACTQIPDADCSSDDEIYELYRRGKDRKMRDALEERNECIYALLKDLRSRTEDAGLLVNGALELTVNFMDLCHQEHLRKLFFMQQFEVMARLSELWRNRIDGCPDAPVLEYQGFDGTRGVFTLVSGLIDAVSDGETAKSFHNYLLVEDIDPLPDISSGAPSSIPPEALFYDLSMCGIMVSNRTDFVRNLWQQQSPDVQRKVLLADVVEIDSLGVRTQLFLTTWPNHGSRLEHMELKPGTRYRLSPRYIDFNAQKTLSTLLELDLQSNGDGPAHPFLQLISDPRSLAGPVSATSKAEDELSRLERKIQSRFKQLTALGVDGANALLLKPSQYKAAQRMLSRHLAVVWGPPGTGKTHTITLGLLRLAEINHLQGSRPLVIFIGAATNAAVEACIDKLERLVKAYRSIEGLNNSWLDKVVITHVKHAQKVELPHTDTKETHIFAGTVFQLYRLSKYNQRSRPTNDGRMSSLFADVVVIDEAGQLSLSLAALALRALQQDGRIVIAGDSEQLAPILAAQYPETDACLFGSVLDVVMHRSMSSAERAQTSTAKTVHKNKPVGREGSGLTQSQESTIVQLTENFRLNEDLGDFISSIYLHKFEAQKTQKKHIARQLRALPAGGVMPVDVLANHFLSSVGCAMLGQPYGDLLCPQGVPIARTGTLQRPISLALLRLRTACARPQQAGYETHVRGEAALAAALVQAIRRACSRETIFVATPHRIQRQAVRSAIVSSRAASLSAEPAAHAGDSSDGDSDSEEFHDALDDLDELEESFAKLGLDGDDGLVLDQRACVQDTVERLQGAEASFVICLFSNTSGHGGLAGLTFLLERRRLNVAISRAQTMCIVISSNEVLRPPVGLLANEQARKGYAFLREYEQRAWAMDVTVNLDPFMSPV